MPGEEAISIELNLFDHFPEPVLYLCGEHIQYSNAALLALEPAWKAGAPLPSTLHIAPEGEGVLLCSAGQQQFQGTATRSEEGVLLVLRPLARPPEAQYSLLPSLLREQAQVILTALHLMEKDAAHTAMNAAMVRQSTFLILRLTRHLEMAERITRQDPFELIEQPVDVADLCRQVAHGVQDLVMDMNIDLQTDLPAGVVIRSADRNLLEAMLLELLSNAIKAVRSGGQVGLRLAVGSSHMVITVWDNGPGLNQQEMSGILTPLSPGELPKSGTGLRLGLPIACHVAQAHGGTLLLENREGRGLTVTVSLPKKHASALILRTPQNYKDAEEHSRVLTMLSDVLPWQAFLL